MKVIKSKNIGMCRDSNPLRHVWKTISPPGHWKANHNTNSKLTIILTLLLEQSAQTT